MECKSWKSRDTQNKRQIWIWSTKLNRAKANRVLSREYTGHSKHSLLTTREMTLHMDIIDGQYQNKTDYIFCSHRLGFPGGSDGKIRPAMQETCIRSLGWEDPLQEGMATHSSILAWRILWTEEPGELQSRGLQRVGLG